MRVLLIEDNPGDARLVQELLKEARGNFTIRVAEKLGTGLKFAAQEDVDVVLLDLGLPDSRGLETLTKLRNQLLHLPVVIMTSSADEALGVQAVRLGAQDYLVKGNVDGELLRRTLIYAIERKRNEEALLIKDAAISTSISGKAFADLNEKITYVNDSFLAMWGYENSDEVIGKHPGDFCKYDEDAIKALKEARDAGRWRGEIIAAKKDGTTFPVEIAATLVKDANGKPICLMASFNDITERKRAEEALRKAHDELELRVQERTKELNEANRSIETERQRFFDVLEMLPAYVVLLTPDYHVPFANRFFRERFGESGGKRCYEYLFNRTEPCEICETYTVLKTNAPHHWEWTGPDGRNYDIYDYPFVDVDGSTLILEMGIDITECKQAEKALRELNDTLEQRVAARGTELLAANASLRDSRSAALNLMEDALAARKQAEEANIELQREVDERKKAEEALHKSSQRLGILSETAGRLLASDKPQELVNKLCEKVMSYLDCHAFFNFLVDEKAGRLRLNAYAGIPEETAKEIEWLDYGVAVCGCAARDGERIVCENIPEIPDPRTELVKSFGIKAYACHPLFARGKVIGTLSFGARSRTHFSEDDLALMKTVADQVAVAMERVKAHEELELRVQERTAELKRVIEVLHGEIRERMEAEDRTKLTNALLKLYTEKTSKKEYLDSVVELIRGWSGCEHIGMRVADKDGNIPYESCVGFSAEFLESENMLSLTRDHCACTRVVAGTPEPQDMPAMTPNGSFYCNHTMKFVEGLTDEQKARFRGVCVRSGFTSVAVIPIRYRERVLGAIHLADEREGMVPLKNVEFLEQMAFIIGEALFRFGIEDDLRKNYDALKAGSDLLENMFTSLHVMIAYMDRDFNFIRVNRAYAEADGKEPEFFVGKNHFALFPYGENEKIFRRVVETGEPYFAFERAFEYAEHPERGVSYWDWSLVPVKEADGRVSGTVLSLIDVTERKRAEERAALFRNLVNQSSDAVFVVDPETSRVLEVNNAACGMMGYEREKILSMNVTDFAERQPDSSRWKEHVAEVREKGVVLLEDRLRRNDGSVLPVEVSVTIVPHEKKDFLVAAVRDITERKRAEEERARLASAVESTAEAVVITDAKGIIRYINPAFEQVTGYTKDEAVGRDLHILDSGKHDEEFYRGMRETMRRDGVWRGRLINKKKDGTFYYEDCTFSPVKGPSGGIINYVSVKRDVTEKLRLESIAESVNTLDNIGYVFSGVRHEIGNPINTVKMILSVLQHKLDKADRESIRDYLNRSLAEIGRVEDLLKSLKNFNMFETMELGNVNMQSFMEKFLKLVAEDFEKRGVAITADVRPEAEWGYADPRALQQALLNIMTNAADALDGREKPAIGVTVMKTDGRIRIRIADNGIGMTEKQQQDLFKPFYTSKPRGSGLGLVIVKKMLTKMHGDIAITSRLNEGTTVDITIPEGGNGSGQ